MKTQRTRETNRGWIYSPMLVPVCRPRRAKKAKGVCLRLLAVRTSLYAPSLLQKGRGGASHCCTGASHLCTFGFKSLHACIALPGITRDLRAVPGSACRKSAIGFWSLHRLFWHVHMPTSRRPLVQAKQTRPGSLSSSCQAWRVNSLWTFGSKQLEHCFRLQS